MNSIPLDKTPRALNFSPDGQLLYFTLAGVDAVQVLDPATNKIVTQIPAGASPCHPLFTPDGKSGLVVSQGPGALAILNPTTSSVTKKVAVGKMPHWIAVNAKGNTAWVTNEGANDVSVVDLDAGTVIATIPVGNAPRKIVIQPQSMTTGQSGFSTTITGFAFVPTMTILAGQTIVWKNADAVCYSFLFRLQWVKSGDYKSLLQNHEIRLRGLNFQPTQATLALPARASVAPAA